MFGYLRVDGHHGRTALAPAQCGLCAHFGARYRTRTRWLAGFDPSVLLLALDGLGDQPALRGVVRCPIPFAAARPAVDPTWEGVVVVGAIQLFLAAEKLFDDRLDRDRFAARLVSAALRRDIARAEEWLLVRGFPLAEAQAAFRQQARLEADPTADLDALSAPTAQGLCLVLDWGATHLGLPGRRALQVFGDRLGRALYLVDALADVRRDQATGAFNPIERALGGVRSPAKAGYVRGVLRGRIAALAEALRDVPLRRNRPVLQAAVVESLSARGDEALVGLLGAAPIRATLEVHG